MIDVADSAAMIQIEALSHVYPGTGDGVAVAALKNIDISIAPGEIYGVIGRSGAGKSTLLRAINALERPSSGRVLVDGADICALRGADLRSARRNIGMIFQHFNLLSSRTTFDNVALPLEFAGVERAKIKARVEELLDLVGIAGKRERYPIELSGGQKQRVGIARALASGPKVLLSDEATSALDPETTRAILSLLAHINRSLGVTIVLITHEMSVVKEICHRVGVLEDGELIEEGDVYDVITRPRTATARSFLGALNGADTPQWLAPDLRPTPEGARSAVLRLNFVGPRAIEPVISRLSRALDADVSILQAQVGEISGRPYGSIVVTVPAQAGEAAAAEEALAPYDVVAERIGYVA